jgi:hypothetical protein
MHRVRQAQDSILLNIKILACFLIHLLHPLASHKLTYSTSETHRHMVAGAARAQAVPHAHSSSQSAEALGIYRLNLEALHVTLLVPTDKLVLTSRGRLFTCWDCVLSGVSCRSAEWPVSSRLLSDSSKSSSDKFWTHTCTYFLKQKSMTFDIQKSY